MQTTEFHTFRKRLGKTQKELAVLLGTSLKAVSSYEQGWRGIPCHVERQLIFLLSRKVRQHHNQLNCWDIKKCPNIKRQQCPAFEFDSGKLCWFINGTICECSTLGTWKEKITVCKMCKVMKGLLESDQVTPAVPR